MKIIKDNWFKLAASLTLIVISVSYYLVIFLPKKEAAILEKQKQQVAAQQQNQERTVAGGRLEKIESSHAPGKDYLLEHIIDNSGYCRIDAEYPDIIYDVPPDSQDKLKSETAKFVNGVVNNYKQDLNCKPSPGIENTLNLRFQDYSLVADKTGESDSIVSLLFSDNEQSNGSATGSFYIYPFNYDLRDSKVIDNLSEVFYDKDKYLSIIADTSKKIIDDNNPEDNWNYLDAAYYTKCIDNIKDYSPDEFSFGKQGISFYFFPCGSLELGNAFSQISVFIPYSYFKDVIRTDGPLNTVLK